jgi:hypothetical protein
MLKWHSVENANHGVIKQEIILSVRVYLVNSFHAIIKRGRRDIDP